MGSHRVGKLVQLLVSLGVLAVAAWVFFNHQLVLDRINVWQYKPSSAIETIVSRAQLTDEGTFYFFASQPQLSDQKAFNRECTNKEDHAVILGCYVAQRIFLYNVQDERLDGVREVTAAHEMLHAAFDRLSKEERQRVGVLLEKELASADDALKERLKVYDSLKDNDKINELHSIIATEVTGIDSELEAYYAQYFKDRRVLVDLFHSYEKVFRDLREQQEGLVTEINQLAEEINNRTATYNQSITALNADIERFNNRANSSGGFSSQEEFDTTRAALIGRQNELEAEFGAIEELRGNYEAKVSQLNEINLQQESLQRSLDSTPAPVPSV